jgi:hypothetical protein
MEGGGAKFVNCTSFIDTRKCTTVDGDQLKGMSGSPVFNGCGLAGVAAAANF